MGQSKIPDTRDIGAAASAAGIPATKRKRSRARVRKEGWDERAIVALAWSLAAFLAVATVYQTIAWAHG
jgi:hypothetical protein